MNEAEVGEHDDVLTIIGNRVRTSRIDDDRAVVTFLLLHVGVAVVPVGAGLFDRELIDKRFAGANAGEGHTRNAIHLHRHEKAVPVN